MEGFEYAQLFDSLFIPDFASLRASSLFPIPSLLFDVGTVVSGP